MGKLRKTKWSLRLAAVMPECLRGHRLRAVHMMLHAWSDQGLHGSFNDALLV